MTPSPRATATAGCGWSSFTRPGAATAASWRPSGARWPRPCTAWSAWPPSTASSSRRCASRAASEDTPPSRHSGGQPNLLPAGGSGSPPPPSPPQPTRPLLHATCRPHTVRGASATMAACAGGRAGRGAACPALMQQPSLLARLHACTPRQGRARRPGDVGSPSTLGARPALSPGLPCPALHLSSTHSFHPPLPCNPALFCPAPPFYPLLPPTPAPQRRPTARVPRGPVGAAPARLGAQPAAQAHQDGEQAGARAGRFSRHGAAFHALRRAAHPGTQPGC